MRNIPKALGPLEADPMTLLVKSVFLGVELEMFHLLKYNSYTTGFPGLAARLISRSIPLISFGRWARCTTRRKLASPAYAQELWPQPKWPSFVGKSVSYE